MNGWPETLAHYPYVRVVIACPGCKRRGEYKLVNLAVRFGPDAELHNVLRTLTADCPYQWRHGARAPGKYDPKCRARYVDLERTERRPDDLPVRDG